MKLDLTDKVVIVTGASRGIGRSTAYEFARWGSKVVLAARDVEALKQAQREIQSSGGRSIIVPTDIQEQSQVQNLVQKTLEGWGKIDVLVNNAGITYHGSFMEMTLDQIRNIVETNLMGAILCIKEVLPYFRKQREGHIVNVSSILGKRAVPGQAVYAATKFALLGLSEAIRCEVAPYNIGVTSFCPSSTSTEMNKLISAGDHPLKQFLRRRFISTPDAVAGRIVRATRLRKREVVLSLPAKAIVRINQCRPEILDWLFTKLEKSSSET